jgi:hypothetical protein
MNLTNMWKAAGSKNAQRPAHFIELPSTQNFLISLENKLSIGLSDTWKTVMGRYGGMYAHYQIVLAFAQYLSPEFHIWCKEVVKERWEFEKLL